jgi:hypothetical protein
MMSMLEEAGDSLGRQSPSQRDNKKVVWHFSNHIAMREYHVLFARINASDFAFNKPHTPLEHRLAQIKTDVIRSALPEGQPDQGWIEDKLAAARHERDLVFGAEFLRERLGRDYAAEPAAED